MVLLKQSISRLVLVFDYYVRPVCQNLSIHSYPLIPQNSYIFMFSYYYYYYYWLL
jgi:hypothetical protein